MRRIAMALLLCVLPVLAGPVEDARALLEQGRAREAADLLLAEVDGPSANAPALVLLTTALNETGDYRRAVDFGERAVEAAPRNSEAHLQYARALRVKMQHHRVKAMFIVGTYKKELQQALDLDPRNVEARLEEIGFLIQAPGIAGGDKKKARERIEQLKPIDWRQAMLMQALLSRAEEDPDAADAVYDAMLERDPDDEEARMALAFSLQARERFRQSDRHFALLLESEKSRRAMTARYQLAWSRVLGEYDQQAAVEHLVSYIEKLTEPSAGLPSASHAHWRLGLAYEQLGRTGEARRALEKALELDGENKQARQALASLGEG